MGLVYKVCVGVWMVLKMWKRLCSRRFHVGIRHVSGYVKISEEVSTALNEGGGVVALESTVITHGMPYPDNIRTAKELEAIIRREKCVPATIAVADGVIHVGITDDLMERLATTKDAIKVSRRDLAVAISKGILGGTTVSATMIASRLAGISVFATGGIGGVHRGVEDTMDISADLTELGRTRVAVVCAGIKSILDIPKTLEFLETQGTPVIAYGQSDNWPGFFTRDSGCRAAYKSEDVREIAEWIETAEKLKLEHGFVIGVPIPEEESEIGQRVQKAIEVAIQEARKRSIRGREVTPFILKRLNELTGGLSLKANMALIKNNAMVAARIASALSDRRRQTPVSSPRKADNHDQATKESQLDAVVIGGTIVDFYVSTSEAVQADGGTHRGVIDQTCGGVGRNHADALTRLQVRTLLISAIGNDQHANFVRAYAPHMNYRSVQTMNNIPTATYAGVTTSGNLNYGVGCMDVHDHITVDWVRLHEAQICSSKILVLDGNIPEETIRYACDLAYSNRVPIWFDPTDQRKAAKICRVGAFTKVTYLSPNFNEFLALMKEMKLGFDESQLRKLAIPDLSNHILNHAHELFDTSDRLSTFVITMGANGVMVLERSKDSYQILHYDPPINPVQVVNVSGAGDCLNSGIIRGLLSNPPQEITEAMDIGLTCASASLRSTHPVPNSLDKIAESLDIIPHIKPILNISRKR